MRASSISMACETRFRTSISGGRWARAAAEEELFVDPGVAKAVVDADRGGDQVLDVAAGDGRELQFEQPGHRHVVDQDLLRLVVDFPALGIRERDGAVGKQ